MFPADEVLGIDPDTLDDGGLAEFVVELQRVRAQLSAVSARLVGAADARRVWADDGYRSTAAWFADRCRLPGREARAEVRLARRRVDLFEGLDGTGNLDGILTPLGRATVAEALKRIENELFEADWREVRSRRGRTSRAMRRGSGDCDTPWSRTVSARRWPRS